MNWAGGWWFAPAGQPELRVTNQLNTRLATDAKVLCSEHRIIVFTLPHSKTSKGYNVDPAPIGRHRNPLRCPVSWLAMFAFIKFWVLGHGMPELLEGSENYFQDRVSP